MEQLISVKQLGWDLRSPLSQLAPLSHRISIMSALSTSRVQVSRPSVASRRSVVVQASSWHKVSSTAALTAAGGKLVVEVSGQKASRELAYGSIEVPVGPTEPFPPLADPAG